jgi:hypothetical protein
MVLLQRSAAARSIRQPVQQVRVPDTWQAKPLAGCANWIYLVALQTSQIPERDVLHGDLTLRCRFLHAPHPVNERDWMLRCAFLVAMTRVHTKNQQ